MAKIDDGNFGMRSRSSVSQFVPRDPGEYDTSGYRNLDAGMRELTANVEYTKRQDQINNDAAAERTRRELNVKIAEENRARSAAALVDYDTSVRQLGQTTAEDLQSGKIQREDVLGKYSESESKIRAAALQQIPADQQELIAPRLAKASEGVQFYLGKAVEQHRKSTILGYAQQITDGMAKQSVEPGADLGKLHAQYEQAMNVLMPDGGAAPAAVGKAIQDFKDRTTSDYLVSRFNERLDSLPGLKDLKGMIGDSKAFPNLDPEKRNVLLHSVNSAMMRLEAKQQADQVRVMSELATDMQNTQKAIETGHVASPELMLGLSARSKGTPLESHFKTLADTNAFIGQFTTAPVAQAEAALLQIGQRISKAKSADEMNGLISMQNSLGSYVAEKRKGLTDDSYATSVQAGAPFVPLDFSNPQALASSVQSRVNAVKAQAVQNPGASQGILLAGDARLFKQSMETQPPAKQAELLGTITRAINDPVVTAHTMKQISKESPMLAQAGWMASMGHLDVATAILDGNHMLTGKDDKHGAMTIPSDEKFRDIWRSRVGDAYSGKVDAEDMDFQAAKMIYASLARHAGKTAQTDVDSRIWKQAIDMSTGGVDEHNSHNVVLPYGMDSSTFRRKAFEALDKAYNSGEIAGAGISGTMKVGKAKADMTTEERYHAEAVAKAAQTGQQYGLNTTPLKPEADDQVTGGQLSRDYIKDLPLESVGQGVYRVRQGTSYVVNDAGYPLAIDLRGGVPAYFWDTKAGRVSRMTTYDTEGGAAVRGLPLEGDPNAGISPLNPNSSTSIELSPDTAAPISKTEMKRAAKPKKTKGGE